MDLLAMTNHPVGRSEEEVVEEDHPVRRSERNQAIVRLLGPALFLSWGSQLVIGQVR
jgi:hypothetical protein